MSRIRQCALAATLFLTTASAQTYTISTVAGGALPVNIPGISASLSGSQSAMAVDAAGNLFFADGNTVLRLDPGTGVITLVAGNGTSGYSGDNGPAVSAQLRNPYGLALDAVGNLYISAFSDNVVRKVSGGVITTIVGTGVAGFSGDDGPAVGAQLNAPYSLAVDVAGNLYISDYGNSRIRRVSAGVITTVAGNGIAGFDGDNGPAVTAQLNGPHALAVDSAGNLYIADCTNNRIRKVSGGVIGTVAGNGLPGFSGDEAPATSAQLDVPCGLALDPAGDLLIADYYNHRIRRVSNGVITTVAGKGTQGFSGDGGPATAAELNDPFVIAIDTAGVLYVADYGNNRIRKVLGGAITTVAGNGAPGFSGDGGSPISAQMNGPLGIALDPAGVLYIADYQGNRIRGISAGVINTVAGTGVSGFSGDGGPAAIAQLSQPSAVVLDTAGNLYIADSGNNRVRRISAGTITTVAGTGTTGFSGDSGPATNAQLNQPIDIALDTAGNLYIADAGNHRVRKVSGTTITTVAGSATPGFSGDAGSAASAQLHSPAGLALDSANNLYIADTGNNRIRKVTGGVITTVAGTSTGLSAPGFIRLTPNGYLYVADTSNNLVRRVANGVITSIAGGGATFADNVPATSSSLAAPGGLAVDPAGNIYIADSFDNRIRLLTPISLAVSGPSLLPSGTVGTAYPSTTFTAVGGTGGYTWSATGLPKGLTLTAVGVLTGTPSVAGTATPQFAVKDSALNTASGTLNLTVDLPVPAITTLSPAAAVVYGAAFTLTVNGTGFLAGAVIQWNGVNLATKLVSATQLTAPVSATLIALTGSVNITVTSGGSVSDTAVFPINPPTPTLASMNPTSLTAGGIAFTLTATGTGFVQASQLQWSGTPLQTSFVSATQVTASVPASLIATAGTASVTATSGGTSSTALTFTIGAPPAITSANPTSVTAYGPAFTLAVTGSGFASGAVIQWNSTPLVTKLVSATQLTAPVPATLIGGAGSVSLIVTSGGVASAAFPFPITPPPPVITTLVPAAVPATGPALTLTVNGTGFTQNATVQWNGAALTTTFGDQTVLTAYVPASLTATAGTANVLVNSGAASSAALKFTINAPPAITTLSPASAVAAGTAFTLTVTGTGFTSGAQVQWNGAALTTTFVSATRLTAAVSTALIANVGSVTIVVSYSGVSSAGATFPINGPPAITGLSPSSATAGGAAFTLTANGTGFLAASAITWNGTALTTKVVSSTQLTASVSAALIASAGTVTVAIGSGGATSTPLNFPINAPPAIAALSPGTVAGTGAPFTLTITGSGFQSGATVQWNGSSLATSYVSANQLTADVPANLAAAAGTASIVAVNPGGAASAAVKLPITASPPAVTQGGVVPLYSSSPVIQAGSWISIYGNGLANGVYEWKGDFPTKLGGTSVKINNKAAYLWSVSPTQINVQAPTDTTAGAVNVVVTAPSGTTTSTVTLAPYGPSFSLLPASHYAASVILTPNGGGAYGNGTYDLAGPSGQFAFSTRPVKPGETMELFGVGFGPTNPAVPAGKAYSGAAPTTTPVTITIGGIPAKVLFAGMTESGVYQFNIIVPAAGGGDQTMLATVGGVPSPAGVLITIQ